mmetsp:Transcript_92971/g.284554  ORF Transcript_92971/g.284554 Transcript_92971/m.284554 type:complete len:261 (+) Transcript_92971:1168-1950(+)
MRNSFVESSTWKVSVSIASSIASDSFVPPRRKSTSGSSAIGAERWSRPATGPFGSTDDPRIVPLPELLDTWVPCIQLRTNMSFSFMLSFSSGSCLVVDKLAIAASLLTTFSRRTNSELCSMSSYSSDSWSASESCSSRRLSVYLKICVHRSRTTLSIRSRGCRATTEMLLLMTSPKTSITSMTKQIKPRLEPASCCLGLERSKYAWNRSWVMILADDNLAGSLNVHERADKPKSLARGVKTPAAVLSPYSTLYGPYDTVE